MLHQDICNILQQDSYKLGLMFLLQLRLSLEGFLSRQAAVIRTDFRCARCLVSIGPESEGLSQLETS